MSEKYNSYRRKTPSVKIGDAAIGGDAPIAVQSMLNCDSHDVNACISQTEALVAAGCDIVRLAMPDIAATKTIAAMKEAGVTVPLVADIHFDYQIALEAVAAGVDKIRINPGNIGDEARVKAVVHACTAHHIPIRIGVNSGSVEKEILAKYHAPTPEALAESAMHHVRLLKRYDFNEIVISVKASDVHNTVLANQLLAAQCPYPLHLGVTEAGTPHMGTVKSAAGIGGLLALGIGDTIRVSLTADPVREVQEAKTLLSALSLSEGVQIQVVSCPTCGRTQIPLIAIAEEFEKRMQQGEVRPSKSLRVALMGCIVNGPGEAKEADIGIAGGKDEAVLIRHGEILRKINSEQIISELIREINLM